MTAMAGGVEELLARLREVQEDADTSSEEKVELVNKILNSSNT